MLELISNVRTGQSNPNDPLDCWDIHIHDGKITEISPYHGTSQSNGTTVIDGGGRFVASSLCHAHIHLDKCFLLQDPKFADLRIRNGDFKEAMSMTSEAKSRFDEEDLLRRGRRLVEESIQHGVTAMRAFVEVDGIVQLKCMHAGIMLREEYKDRCHIQLCAFAQLPLFSGEDNGLKVRELMAEAAKNTNIEVVGSTPYVEDDRRKSLENATWITQLALEHKKHLDLHLDYFLDENQQPLVWDVLNILKKLSWPLASGPPLQDRQVTLGHCTRLTRFTKEEWTRLRDEIDRLPVSFVGLPTSDLFMMRTLENVRGTLPVVEMIREHGLMACIAVNNVGNAFTPQGNCDPLRIAELGVGLYQAGTEEDTQILYEAVSSGAKAAIGCEAVPWMVSTRYSADLVLYDRLDSGWKCKRNISDIVYNAPRARITVFRGRVTSRTD